MMNLPELWKHLKFVSEYTELTASQKQLLEPVLYEELQARELKRTRYLLNRSGIKKIKRIEDFDWLFNPKIPRETIMPFFNSSQWAEKGANVVFIGPTGVGKSHLSDALCYQMITRYGIPATRITCFYLVEKMNNIT
jgi:DNA replication protein DnaC